MMAGQSYSGDAGANFYLVSSHVFFFDLKGGKSGVFCIQPPVPV